MSWKAIDRRTAPADAGPGLSEAVREKIRSFFGRYPTKRAAVLPALHVAQDAIGYISLRAMREIAELLEINPSDVADVVTFYTHFWTRPKGRKVIVICRSLTCQLMGQREVQAAVERHLGIGEHGTTADGRYSLMTEECLAACDHAPCMLINEKMHRRVRAEDVPRLLEDPGNDRLETPRSDLYDAPRGSETAGAAAGAGAG